MNLQLTPIASAVALVLMNSLSTAQAQQAPAAPADAASAPAPAAVAKKPDANLETVTIIGIRGSRQQSLNQKRNADSIVDVVTAEDVGKMPDKNVADAIQRIPGVNTASSAGGEGGFDENDRVSIRGTSPSLTQTLINGHSVSTGDWFVLNLFGTTVGRSASYSLLPSELVGKVTVHKSAMADLPEGGAVGNVNIETRHPLDFKKTYTGELSLGGAYSELAKKGDPQFSALWSFKNEDSTAGVLFQVFSETRHLRRDGQEILGYFQIPAEVADATSPTGKKPNPVVVAHPDLNGVMVPSLIGNALFEQERVREGGAIEFQFKPTNDFTFGISGLYSRMNAKNMNTNFMASPKWLLDAGISPTNYQLSADGKTLLSATFPVTAAANSYISDSGIRPGAKSESSYLNIDGSWRASDRFLLTGQVGTTRGVGQSLEYASEVGNGGAVPLGLSYSMNGMGGATNVAFAGGDYTKYSSAMWNWNFGAQVKSVDREHYAQADGLWSLDGGVLESLKFGARFTDHQRDNGQFIASGPNWANPNVGTNVPGWSGGTYPSDFGSAFGAPLPGIWRLTYEDIAKWATVSTQANPNPNAVFNYDPAQRHQWTNDFNVKEKTSAAYVMANLGGNRWSGNVGVRVVHTQQSSLILRNPTPTDTNVDNSSLFGPFVSNWEDRSYTDILPSANAKLKVSRDFVLRTSVTRTMARPDYTALSSATVLNDQLNSGSSGNPNLDPIRANNLDVMAEWYFAPRSILSAGLFYQKYSSFVTYGRTVGNYFSDLHKRYEDYTIVNPLNIGAKNKGVELGYQQPFGSFGLNANYTYANGKTDDGGEMAGNSRNTYNIEGYFENDTWSARLAYTYRSSFLAGLDRSSQLHGDEVGTLAASINYKINDNLSVSLDGLNLNNPTLKYYADTKEQPRAFYSNGRQYYLSLRVKM